MRCTPRRPRRGEPVDQAAQPLPFRAQVSRILHHQILRRRRILRIGASFPSTIGFTIRPMIHPSHIRGGILSPTAHSNARAQCASACAGLDLAHTAALSGRSCAIRACTSSTLAASKRCFMWTNLHNHLHSGKRFYAGSSLTSQCPWNSRGYRFVGYFECLAVKPESSTSQTPGLGSRSFGFADSAA